MKKFVYIKFFCLILDKVIGDWSAGKLTDSVVQSALAVGVMTLSARDQLEENLVGLPSDSPSYKHQKAVKTSARATYLARTGYVLDIATKNAIK